MSGEDLSLHTERTYLDGTTDLNFSRGKPFAAHGGQLRKRSSVALQCLTGTMSPHVHPGTTLSSRVGTLVCCNGARSHCVPANNLPDSVGPALRALRRCRALRGRRSGAAGLSDRRPPRTTKNVPWLPICASTVRRLEDEEDGKDSDQTTDSTSSARSFSALIRHGSQESVNGPDADTPETSWAVYRRVDAKLGADFTLSPPPCTHLIYAFALIKEGVIEPFDALVDLDGDGQYGGYQKFNLITKSAKPVTTLLAVGGWNAGSQAFSDMAMDPDTREEFGKQAVTYLRRHGFQGLDIDWEYPRTVRARVQKTGRTFRYCYRRLEDEEDGKDSDQTTDSTSSARSFSALIRHGSQESVNGPDADTPETVINLHTVSK
ncbi:putative Chitotriosidase-1 [Hypsibius exemplaris]|uniref:Chitotriosidase-1 n=1 Tax=Hypsibius exemplaris TaxID=2072580 RepID=A0A9X6RN41_HYPEX|nr:putative Chitotriosidase-1 [Hypsibius exemplaris]